MKKFTKILTASLTAFVMGASSIVAYADTEGEKTETDLDVTDTSDHGVYVSYVDATTAATVYSVDVEWGEMEFTYTESGSKTWNPKTHAYDATGKGEWSEKGNSVTVTNHSNAAVEVDVALAVDETYKEALTAVTMNLTNSTSGTTLDAPDEGSKAEDAPSVEYTLTLSGTPTDTSSLSADFKQVATLTVVLATDTKN